MEEKDIKEITDTDIALFRKYPEDAWYSSRHDLWYRGAKDKFVTNDLYHKAIQYYGFYWKYI